MHKENFGKNSLLQQKLLFPLYFVIQNGNLFFTSVKSGVQTLQHETWKKACKYNYFQQEKSKCNVNKKVKWRFSSCLVSHVSFGTISLTAESQSPLNKNMSLQNCPLAVWLPYKFLRALWITWIPMGSSNSASHLLCDVNADNLCGLTELVMSSLVGGLIK